MSLLMYSSHSPMKDIEKATDCFNSILKNGRFWSVALIFNVLDLL
ncbi:hypothetical protein ACQKMI_10070 [Lysinibacillus sp. NPDC097214]